VREETGALVGVRLSAVRPLFRLVEKRGE